MDLYVELSPRDYQYFMKRESELRGQERMTMLGKVLAGVIAFLAVPGLAATLSRAPGKSVLWSFLFGMLWGVGGVTFGLFPKIQQ